MTQTQFSRISRTAQSTVLDIETGAVSVSLDMYLRLLEALGAELTVTDRPATATGAKMPRKRRGIRRKTTAVWVEHACVGTLTGSGDGRVGFSYDPGWLALDTASPGASLLPLKQADWRGDFMAAAFDKLLPEPEGELRDKVAACVGAAGKDVFSLLSAVGRDCVRGSCNSCRLPPARAGDGLPRHLAP